MALSFMLFTTMRIHHSIFHNMVYSMTWENASVIWRVSWARMCNYLAWMQDELHLGFKSLFCNLTGCFDRLWRLKLPWKLFSHLLSVAQLFWALPKTGIHHLWRDVRRCQDVDLSSLSLPCKWDSIVKMTEDSSWREAPSKSESFITIWVATGTLISVCPCWAWPQANNQTSHKSFTTANQMHGYINYTGK